MYRCLDRKPVEEVVASIKHHATFTACSVSEISSGDARKHGLVNLVAVKGYRATAKEVWYCGCRFFDVYVNNLTFLVYGIGLWIDVHSFGEAILNRSPHLALQGIDVCVAVVWVEYDNAIVVIIINHVR